MGGPYILYGTTIVRGAANLILDDIRVQQRSQGQKVDALTERLYTRIIKQKTGS